MKNNEHQYRYNPDDFEISLKEELIEFYADLENHQKENTTKTKILLKLQLNNVKTRTKHAKLHKTITPDEEQEINAYIEVLGKMQGHI